MRSTQARSSCSERTFPSESIGSRWRTFSSRSTALAADALRRRVGALQLWVGGLERAQLVEQLVVLVIPDLRVVEHVVAVGVVLELGAQRGGALEHLGREALRGPLGCGAHGSASRAAGASSCSRSKLASASMLRRSVRSKWIGVTAMRPAATAARSVPGSSWKPGSEPYIQ